MNPHEPPFTDAWGNPQAEGRSERPSVVGPPAIPLAEWIPARAATLEHEVIAAFVAGRSGAALIEQALRMAALGENLELTAELSPPRHGGFPPASTPGPGLCD